MRAIEIVSQFAFNPYSLAVSHKPGQPALRHDNDNDRCLNLLDNGSEKARVPFFLFFFFRDTIRRYANLLIISSSISVSGAPTAARTPVPCARNR